MVSAYGGSNPIQWKTTEYLIPKVRLEHHCFYVLNIVGIMSCEFYFLLCFLPYQYYPVYFRTTLTRTSTCFFNCKSGGGEEDIILYIQ